MTNILLLFTQVHIETTYVFLTEFERHRHLTDSIAGSTLVVARMKLAVELIYYQLRCGFIVIGDLLRTFSRLNLFLKLTCKDLPSHWFL